MAEFPSMPLWTDAYLGDTTHLTTIEHGAYLLLLIAMWRTKAKNLPDDDRLLARYARLTAGQWRRIRPILAPFFDIENGTWTQGRLTDEADAVRQNSKKQSDKAKRRWLKNKKTGDAVAKPEPCRSDASRTHTQNALANANGADAPERPLVEIIFGPGLRLLTGSGVAEPNARSLLGKWRGQHGDEALLAALGRAQREGAIDPVGFIQGCFRASGRRKDKADDRADRILRMAGDLDGRAEAECPVDSGAGFEPAFALLPARSGGRN